MHAAGVLARVIVIVIFNTIMPFLQYFLRDRWIVLISERIPSSLPKQK